MKGLLANAREKLASAILEDFKGRITGDSVPFIIGENPENRFFVGKLSPGAEERDKGFGSDVRISSIGVDFNIHEKDYRMAKLIVYPRGDFYYRAYPTLEQQRKVFLEYVNNVINDTSQQYDTFEKLIEDYNNGSEKLQQAHIKLVPVYKKVSLYDENNYIKVSVKDIYDYKIGESDTNRLGEQNSHISDWMEDLQEHIVDNPYYYSAVIHEETTVRDLLSESSYKNFLVSNRKKDVLVNQNWQIKIDVDVKKIQDKYLISILLVNKSEVHSNAQTHISNRKDSDKTSIETLFNAGMYIKLKHADYLPVVMDYFLDDYKYDRKQIAIGSNCSVLYNKDMDMLCTENIPMFIQHRLITRDDLAVKFKDLMDNPIPTLEKIVSCMEIEIKKWNTHFENTKGKLTDKGQNQMQSEIEGFRMEINRFKFGIQILHDYPVVCKSFKLMNETFLKTSKKYDTWRLFQIVYIVSILPDIVSCDEKIMTAEEKAKTTLGDVSLLYFPTGGGKTEAFLGVLIFNVFFDRFRGKNSGVTSILRYPLRLLSVQQVQRLANVLAQAELIRRREESIKHTAEFSLGYFVGDANTPNQMDKEEAKKFKALLQEEKDEHKIIDICPFCGQASIHVDFDDERYRLTHVCDNPKCASNGKALPIYIVDNEIYRFLPTAIISTVDKLAILGNNAKFRNILCGAPKCCPKHGVTSTKKCSVPDGVCDIEVHNFKEIDMYDPAPTLFIQDELHLIRESLGTYASHYESFIDYFVRNVSKSRRRIKVIGATATISSYAEQITQLYGKDPVMFPCASIFSDKNFYSFIGKTDIQRMIIGYAPYGRAIINSTVYSLKYMREAVYRYLDNPSLVLKIPDIGISTIDQATEILKDYWIFLQYNNVKRDGNNIEGALETPINVELAKEGIPQFITRKMTGDETFQDVRQVLAQVENSKDVFNDLNLIIATSMISHGVDADRFNIMFFFGIPGNTAEYIQAYSRTGRQHTSIVVDIIRPSRETDQSYLRNFCTFHEYKDIMVEPVPLNRWAVKAIDGTLPGIFTGLLLCKYDPELQYTCGSLFFMSNIKKAIETGKIESEIIKNELLCSYGCISNGVNVDLGNQYRRKIEYFVDHIFAEIKDRSWPDESIFTGFAKLGYHIMSSMRDTDEQLIIELA